jgi:hypothetical protein
MNPKNSKIKNGNDTLSHGEKLFAKLASFYAEPPYHFEREMIFGFDCLRSKGKVFAKLHDGHLVMKLPANRIKSLVDSGEVSSYELRGRITKEWGVISTSKDIIALAEEARVFIESAKSIS